MESVAHGEKRINEKENREHIFPADNHHQLSLYLYEKIRDFLNMVAPFEIGVPN